MSTLTAATHADAGMASALFARPEFASHPARACHSLIRRLPEATDEAAIRENLATARLRDPQLADLRVWTERLDVPAQSPAAELRRAREARRPIGRQSPRVLAVLLRYQDGPSDLILVANRARTGRQDLEYIAALLSGDVHIATTPDRFVTPPASPTRPAEVLPSWGLGDARRSGEASAIEFCTLVTDRPARPAVLAATGLLLSRYTGDSEIRFPVLTSRRAATDELVLQAMNFDEGTTLGELLADASEQGLGYGSCLQGLPPVGVMMGEVHSGERYVPCVAPVFPVTLSWMLEGEGRVRGELLYDHGALDPDIARQLSRHARLLAERIVSLDLNIRVRDIPLVDTDETAAILEAGRPPAHASRAGIPIHRRFEELARAQPDMPALSDGDRTLSYRELEAQASLAADGLRARGVTPGDMVGICLERDASLVITMLGVLMAGAAYVPIDPVYPAERISYTVRDAGLRIVVNTDQPFPEIKGVATVRAEELQAPAHDTHISDPVTTPDSLAYVIYTSGSTGRPKGVAVPHRNVSALLEATVGDMQLAPSDNWTLFHSSAFDFSVWEIWGCLLSGGHLVVVPYWVSRSPNDFRDLLAQHRITVLSQTPSAFAALLEADSQHAADLALRLVVLGGESLSVRMLSQWFRRYPPTRCRVVNMFGITETTVHVTSQTITPVEVESDSRSVGRALPGWSVSVRDRAGRVQPFGVAGEIFVAGAGVASRYLGRAELTAERFVRDPVNGERVYRSGDLGLLRPDGRLEHLGRIDRQVKIRGFRIEPDEIRSVLLEDPGVTSAAVILSVAADGDAGRTSLDGYVVLQPDASLADVRRRARHYLPEHMMPATLAAVPSIPLTVNGKVDSDMLKALTVDEPVAASTDSGIGGLVLRVWREVLGRPVRADDDFFESGGNSLVAVRLFGALRRAGLPAPSLRDLYLHSTPAELSAFLMSAPDTQAEG